MFLIFAFKSVSALQDRGCDSSLKVSGATYDVRTSAAFLFSQNQYNIYTLKEELTVGNPYINIKVQLKTA